MIDVLTPGALQLVGVTVRKGHCLSKAGPFGTWALRPCRTLGSRITEPTRAAIL